jgi:hypothetical protein
MKLLKNILIIMLIIAASIRMAYVDSEKRKHLNTCPYVVKKYITTGVSILPYRTCKHL